MVAFRRVVLPLLLSAAFVVPAARAQSARRNPFSGVPVTGTSDGNPFQGTMDILGFINDGGTIKAIGSLTATMKSATGAVQQIAGAMILVPVENAVTQAGGFGGLEPGATKQLRTNAPATAQASCPILDLHLGPLDLNLLGLTVHLAPVNLNITAVPGAGNLLGNLLCAVANLLNPGFSLNQLGGAILNALTQLLNNLIAALAGL